MFEGDLVAVGAGMLEDIVDRLDADPVQGQLGQARQLGPFDGRSDIEVVVRKPGPGMETLDVRGDGSYNFV